MKRKQMDCEDMTWAELARGNFLWRVFVLAVRINAGKQGFGTQQNVPFYVLWSSARTRTHTATKHNMTLHPSIDVKLTIKQELAACIPFPLPLYIVLWSWISDTS
jgi:hypothetical protein